MTSDTQVLYSREGEAQPHEGEVDLPDMLPVDPSAPGEAAPMGTSNNYHAELNHDPLRRRIRIPRRGLLHRISSLLSKPELNAAERAALDEEARLKQLQQVLREEARDASTVLSHALARMGRCYKRISPDGEIRVKKFVTFDLVSLQEDALWFHVDMRRLPYGVSKNDLISQDVIDDLSCSLGRRVGVRHDAETGVWYIVERASGRMGIPTHVMLKEMWDRMPQSATSLTIPMGMTNNRKLVYENLADGPHWLVAGGTGWGKSNFLNVVLCTLLTRNTPDQLQLVLVDLKEGLEFSFYEGVPHLVCIPDISPKGILYDREKVLPALDWVIAEGHRRMTMIRDAGHKDISKFNAHRQGKNRLSRMIVVIDEWADVRLSGQGKETEEKLSNAVQLLRAAGIHFIVCTQVPSKEVLSMRIRTNLPAKVAFNCPDMAASLAILGNTDAFAIGVLGRAVVRARQQLMVQVPYISDELVRSTVKSVISGQTVAVEKRHDVTIQEVLEWALHENQAELSHRDVFKTYRDRGITDVEVRLMLEEADGTEFVIGSDLYRVEPGGSKKPRRLVAVDNKKSGEEPKP
mgnify:CR=1 FL=1